MSIHASGQSGRHSLALRGADLYETPRVATEALIRAEKLPWRIWEPAAGRGAICDVLKANGYTVYATDLYDYGNPAIYPSRDFLDSYPEYRDDVAIVTNPPYSLAAEFVAHAIEFVPLVCFLLRLAFLESVKRTDILENSCLARVHVFKRRLPMMHRDGWKGPRATSATAFAWFVWQRGHTGPATIDRIDWRTP